MYTTICQTPSVLRQAVYEKCKTDQLHPDINMELAIAKESWKAAMPGLHIEGYIRHLGCEPFYVVFYTHDQVSSYVTACKMASGAALHIDATGSVTKRLPGQKTPLCYIMILEENGLPVFDALTTRHSSEWLQSAAHVQC